MGFLEFIFDALITLLFEHTMSPRWIDKRTNSLSDERMAELNAKLMHPEEIQRLLDAKQKIQAIKLYREETGAGLKEARAAVEQMEASARAVRSTRNREQDAQIEHGGDALEQVRQLMSDGRKFEAIKRYREATGAGLKEAKAAVEGMAGMAGTTGTASIADSISAGRTTESGFVDPDELARLIRAGRKIEAIKYFRRQSGAGLREAKEAVDWLEANMRGER